MGRSTMTNGETSLGRQATTPRRQEAPPRTPGSRIWQDRRTLLSTLWVFLVLNFIYADVFSIMFDPAVQEQAADFSGTALPFAVLMETAMAMVLLARVLPYAWNRGANIVIAVLHTAVLVWTLVDAPVTSFYVFFVAIEIAALLFVVGYAWTLAAAAPSGAVDRAGSSVATPGARPQRPGFLVSRGQFGDGPSSSQRTLPMVD